MKTIFAIMWLCLSAVPALADYATSSSGPSVSARRSAPAPLIGLGVPVVLAVGGVLVGAKLVRRRRKS
jgi:hypothetical protein